MVPFKKMYDLSQPVYDKCPGWPTYEMTDVVYEALYPTDKFTAEQIKMNVHTGTHLDAPFHFFPTGKTIDQFPVDLYQGEAVLVDLRGKLAPAQGIGPEQLEPYADRIGEGSIVVLCTGWGQKRAFTDEYYKDWPYLNEEGAKWLLNKKVKGVGIDGFSMGGWYEGTGRPCHEVLLAAEVWLLEELNIPDELMEYDTCYLMAFPLKLKGFTGAPTRAVAMVF
ncbi:MAG: cyclase family protein [Eubacteriales bacterium]|jgi:arylformamidase